MATFDFGTTSGSQTAERLIQMRDSLTHRGPDGAGIYVSPDRRVGMAHRRLAIVDVDGGAQPMISESGEVVVFNGEIYNYPQLRSQLHAQGMTFRTRCDTEVILHLYRRYGEQCVDHLDGMFAFVLWDPSRRRLFFARDRLGEKPLYWAQLGGTLILASEIKAILRHPLANPEVNRAAIGHYLANLVTPSPATLFRNIYKVSAGTAGVCTDSGGPVFRRYWDLFAPRRVTRHSMSEAAAEIGQQLERSVASRLMSDVPVGILLSGGLDSTALVAMLHERAHGMATFSVGYDGSPADERPQAREIARYFGTEHHEVAVSERDALGFLPDLVHHQDEPLADPVCVPLNFVCKLAADTGIKVVLAGEGSDELFWGYPQYSRIIRRWPLVNAVLKAPRVVRSLLPGLVRVDRSPALREFLNGVAAGRLLPLHVPVGVSGAIRGRLGWCGDIGWLPSVGSDGSEGSLEQVLFDTQEYEFGLRLPELLLMRIDRFSMANSVEARVPFLDPRLVEYAYRLPLSLKIAGGTTKAVLKTALAGRVPANVLTQRKRGFSAPAAEWFDGRMRGLIESLLGEPCLATYFEAEAIRALLHGHGRSGDRSGALWPLLNFALWHKAWIEGDDIRSALEPHLVGTA